MANLQSTTINDTGFITLPAGNTASRPASPQAGMLRFNTDTNRLEHYNGSSWDLFPLRSQTFNYTGSDQTFTVPTGVTNIIVKAWGGGGGGGGQSGWSDGGPAGGGGFATGSISTTPGTQYTIVVGSRGFNRSPNRTYGGGGRPPNTWGPGSGGGLSGIFQSGAAFSGGTPQSGAFGRAILIAGGGGGGGANRNPGSTRGGAGGGQVGESGTANYANNWGNGGTQNAGGTGNGGPQGGQLSGSDCNASYGAGGGGGYYGGGAGNYVEPLDMGGGGGGSGYFRTSGTNATVTNASLSTGAGMIVGGSDDFDRGNAGNGGFTDTQGTDGRVIIYW